MKKAILIILALIVAPLFIYALMRDDDGNGVQTQTTPTKEIKPQTKPAVPKDKGDEEEPEEEPAVEYEIVEQGTYSGLKEPLTRVITAKGGWEEVWKTHVSMLVPQPPVPESDFETSVMAVIAAGEKRSSGYRIVINDISMEGSDVVIHYKVTEPPKNSMTLTVITQPFMILRLAKPEGTVRFVKDA